MKDEIFSAPQDASEYMQRAAAEGRIKFYNVPEGMRATLLRALSQPDRFDEVKRIARDINRHPMYPRKCLSCGAVESLDGSVPCGH